MTGVEKYSACTPQVSGRCRKGALLYGGADVTRRFSLHTHRLSKAGAKSGNYHGDLDLLTLATSAAKTHPSSNDHYIRQIDILI